MRSGPPDSSIVFRLLAALVLALPLSVFAAGVSSPPPSAPADLADGDWLINHLDAEPATLNPITASDAYASEVDGFIYEGLIERDNATLEFKGKLAESWSVSPDHLTYTFKLRKGILFHDGTPLTAHDIKFAYDTVKNPKVDAAHLRNYYEDVKLCEVPDDLTVRFTMSKPYFKALEMLGGLYALPRHIFEKGDFNNHPAGRAPVGTGPYKFVKWETGREIVLERNPSYWGPKVHLGRIVYRIITDRNAALQVYKKGELDVLGVRPDQWERELDEKTFHRPFRKVLYYTPNYSYIGWNSRRPWFGDKRVRRAMTMLLDRETLLKKIRFGLGKVVSGTFYVNGPEYDQTIRPWPFDPEAAKKLLDEAGWKPGADGLRQKDGKPFSFELMISAGSTFAEQMATIFKEQLAKVGIEMRIRKLEWAVFTQFLDERNFDAATLGWSLSVEEDPYQLWHSSQVVKGGSNYTGFVNQEADGLIEKARIEFDKQKRVQMYRRLHAIQHDEQPYSFMLCSPNLLIYDARFKGVTIYPLGPDTREWYVPKSAQLYPAK